MKIKSLISDQFLNPRIHTYAVLFLIIVEMVLAFINTSRIHDSQIFKMISLFLYSFLLIWSIFYLFFDPIDETRLLKLKDNPSNHQVYAGVPENKITALHNFYQSIYDSVVKKGKTVYQLKFYEQIISPDNWGNYLKIFFLLFAGGKIFNSVLPVSFIFYELIVLLSLIGCVYVALKQFFIGFRNNQLNDLGASHSALSFIVIGHLILAYLLFAWAKNSISRNYGEERLGSFFEKPEYKTQYYVLIFPDNSISKNYKLVADIEVSSEIDSYEDDDGSGIGVFAYPITRSYSHRLINIDKVYLPNGGYLTFDDCELEKNAKAYCTDQDGRQWTIELTPEKVIR